MGALEEEEDSLDEDNEEGGNEETTTSGEEIDRTKEYAERYDDVSDREKDVDQDTVWGGGGSEADEWESGGIDVDEDKDSLEAEEMEEAEE